MKTQVGRISSEAENLRIKLFLWFVNITLKYFKVRIQV